MLRCQRTLNPKGTNKEKGKWTSAPQLKARTGGNWTRPSPRKWNRVLGVDSGRPAVSCRGLSGRTRQKSQRREAQQPSPAHRARLRRRPTRHFWLWRCALGWGRAWGRGGGRAWPARWAGRAPPSWWGPWSPPASTESWLSTRTRPARSGPGTPGPRSRPAPCRHPAGTPTRTGWSPTRRFQTCQEKTQERAFNLLRGGG